MILTPAAMTRTRRCLAALLWLSAGAAQAADREVMIAQIGSSNSATVIQSAARARATVTQTGDRNGANVVQSGSATAAIDIRQTGDANTAYAAQSGMLGGNDLRLSQLGARNAATVTQRSDGMLGNVAALVQNGYGNTLAITQDGDDNAMRLKQIGNDNAMTAEQHGAGNQLEWTQQGNNLASLGIVQTGGAQAAITQSR